ncbi:hypothetical protein [Streptomyces sp. NPDC088915]|uniref:hypothetical protein n=1 Tax=Streptomyces sp. NPDC088915 TaxID=3365912 RepID=UPI00381CBD3F
MQQGARLIGGLGRRVSPQGLNGASRLQGGAQLFVLYVIVDEVVFFGCCPIRSHKVVARGETIEDYDLVGKGGETSGGARQVQ